MYLPLSRHGPLSFIYDGSRLPPPATYPPASDEQPLFAGIHGLATYGTYGRSTSLPPRWALTPPFHPYRPRMRMQRLAVLFCYAAIPSRISSRLACVVLFVARTFLSRTCRQRQSGPAPAKVAKKSRTERGLRPGFFSPCDAAVRTTSCRPCRRPASRASPAAPTSSRPARTPS